jgi:hypothetical protein
VLDPLTKKDFQEMFHQWRRHWDQCLHDWVLLLGWWRLIGRMVNFMIFTVSVQNILDTPRIFKMSAISNIEVPVLFINCVHIHTIVLLWTCICYLLYVLGSNISLETGLSAIPVINSLTNRSKWIYK